MNLIQAFTWNLGTYIAVLRESIKWRPHKILSIDTECRGGSTCSSGEVSVMEMERRGWIILSYLLDNSIRGGTYE